MSAPTDKAQLTRAFFRELVREQRLETGFAAGERRRWLGELAERGQLDPLFELEMWLKGLAYYFNLHNQPIVDINNVAARDFLPEIAVVAAAVERVAQLGPRLHRGAGDKLGQFRQYLASVAASDPWRGRFLSEALQQRTPEESLAVLLEGVAALRALLAALGQQTQCSLLVFKAAGTLVTRELVRSRFFNPFAAPAFTPELDGLTAVPVLEAVARVPVPIARRALQALFMGLERCHRYLGFVPSLADSLGQPGGQDPASLAILALVHAEVNQLAAALQPELVTRLGAWEGASSFVQTATGLSETLRRDLRQIMGTVLGQAERDAMGRQVSSSVSVSAAMLAASLESATLGLLSVLQPHGVAPDAALLFDPARRRAAASLRLRLDLSVLAEGLQQLAGGRAFDLTPLLTYVRGVALPLASIGLRRELGRFMSLAARVRTAPSVSSSERLIQSAGGLVAAVRAERERVEADPAVSAIPSDEAASRALAVRLLGA